MRQHGALTCSALCLQDRTARGSLHSKCGDGVINGARRRNRLREAARDLPADTGLLQAKPQCEKIDGSHLRVLPFSRFFGQDPDFGAAYPDKTAYPEGIPSFPASLKRGSTPWPPFFGKAPANAASSRASFARWSATAQCGSASAASCCSKRNGVYVTLFGRTVSLGHVRQRGSRQEHNSERDSQASASPVPQRCGLLAGDNLCRRSDKVRSLGHAQARQTPRKSRTAPASQSGPLRTRAAIATLKRRSPISKRRSWPLQPTSTPDATAALRHRLHDDSTGRSSVRR